MKRQRIEISHAADLWAADNLLVTGPGLERLVQEEYARLAVATGRNTNLLTDGEVETLRQSARATVLKRLKAQNVSVVADDDDDGAVAAVRAADDLADELRDVRAEFGSTRTDIDETSALIHQKACVVLAASRKPMNETTSLAALNAVASAPASGRASDPDLERHLETAAALADLARIKAARAWTDATR